VTFAQRRNRLTMHFSERISVVKRRIAVHTTEEFQNVWIQMSKCHTLSSEPYRVRIVFFTASRPTLGLS